MDRVSRPQVRHGAAPGRDRDARDLRQGTAQGVRARLRGESADRARMRQARQAPGFSLDRRGLRNVPRPRVRPGGFPARVRPDQQAALDLRLREAADGPGHSRLRHERRARLHAVPAVQLDRFGAGQSQRVQGRQLAGDHPVLRPYRPRRAHQARGRRHAEARVYLHRRRHRRADEDHREPQRDRDRKNLQHRQPEEQLFGQGSRRHDGEARPGVPRIPRQREEGEARQDDGGRVLRQGLSGRAEPRAQDLAIREGSQLAAAGQHARRPEAHLPRLPDARRRSAAAGRMKLALKVDVDTYRGTRRGVPRLVELLKKHGAGATFLFSPGPDHTGRAIKRVFRGGFIGKASRTSVLSHYGLATLLYGTLLPGPDIGRRCAGVMPAGRDSGCEVGIDASDHVKWQDGVPGADARWTERQMLLSRKRFEEIFGEPARAHGAAGWQTNLHALPLTQRLGFDYCSDTRGSCPFIPVWRAEIVACPQLPTTLPTLDELIGTRELTAKNVADHVLDLTRERPAAGHVYTLHAELEGGKLAPAFETMLAGWKSQGYDLVSMRTLAESLDLRSLPRNEIAFGGVARRS